MAGDQHDQDRWGGLVDNIHSCNTSMCAGGFMVNSSDELRALAKKTSIATAAKMSMPHLAHVFYYETQEMREYLRDLI